MGGNFKFQVQDSFLEYLFFKEIGRFEKRIPFPEKKLPLHGYTKYKRINNIQTTSHYLLRF